MWHVTVSFYKSSAEICFNCFLKCRNATTWAKSYVCEYCNGSSPSSCEDSSFENHESLECQNSKQRCVCCIVMSERLWLQYVPKHRLIEIIQQRVTLDTSNKTFPAALKIAGLTCSKHGDHDMTHRGTPDSEEHYGNSEVYLPITVLLFGWHGQI
jgi:hypothetical protein